jgi:hypothetical protein
VLWTGAHPAIPVLKGEPMSTTIAAEALRFRHELNLGVLPVDAATKKPRIKGWQNGGLRAEASVVKVFDRMPEEAFVGVPTGYPLAGGGFLYVLDVDGRNGGLEALSALPELPETVTAKTKDGAHYWFRTATPLPGQFRDDGLELKGAGQYVVVPPAPGRTWIRDPFEFEIADCPDFLLPQPQIQLVRSGLQFRVDTVTGEIALDLSNPLAELRRAKPGSRRQTLLRVAGMLANRTRQGVLSEKQARQELLASALSVGIASEEAHRIIDYAFTHDRLTTAGERQRVLQTSSCQIETSQC